jgi:hypothetical protein
MPVSFQHFGDTMTPARLLTFVLLLGVALSSALHALPCGVANSLPATAVQERSIQVTNAAGKSTRIDDKILKALPRQKVDVKDADGKTAVFEGVGLATLLEQAGIKLEKELRGQRLANYLLVEAKDGYRVVFALPEIDVTNSDNIILFADTSNGKALDDKDGPFRLVVPREKHHYRWIRQVAKISEVVATPAK